MPHAMLNKMSCAAFELALAEPAPPPRCRKLRRRAFVVWCSRTDHCNGMLGKEQQLAQAPCLGIGVGSIHHRRCLLVLQSELIATTCSSAPNHNHEVLQEEVFKEKGGTASGSSRRRASNSSNAGKYYLIIVPV